jgi:hypothetical protein
MMSKPLRKAVLLDPKQPDSGVEVEFRSEEFQEPSSVPNRIGSGRIYTSAAVFAPFVGKQPLILRTDEGDVNIELLSNGEFFVVIVQ